MNAILFSCIIYFDLDMGWILFVQPIFVYVYEI
nr:MAG TPA: hypothetical protein [Caudoviricetes sp.]